MPQWYQNYTNRVKKFIFEMINPETQIVINDDSKIIDDTTKKGIYKYESFVQKRPLFFRSYKSEKERIQAQIKDNQYLNGIYDSNGEKINDTKFERKSKNKLISNAIKRNKYISLSPDNTSNINNVLFQSNDKSINLSQTNKNDMIFNKIFPGKSHSINNLKSIYSSLNDKKCNIRNKNILRKIRTEKKFNFSGSFDYKRMINIFEKRIGNKTEKIKKNSFNKSKNNISQYNSKTKNRDKRKSNKNDSKISNNSSFNKSFHSKLHFKAAEEIAENKYDKKNKYLLLLPNLLKKPRPIKKEEFFLSDAKEDIKSDEDEEIFFDSFYYKNPYKDLQKSQKYNPNLMKQLSKIAFAKDNNLKMFKTENKIDNNINQTFNRKMKNIKNKIVKDEDEVEIDGEIFVKTNQFNLITKKILHKCHLYNNKSIKNRNSLKIGTGKNMMTKGLSVNNFMKKYKLKY